MSGTVAVDASIVIKWVLEESDSNVAEALLAEWIDQGKVILAPELLAYEVANTLYQKVRKGAIAFDRANLALSKALGTGLELECIEDTVLSTKAIELANRFNLPAVYDAHYLALAEHKGCELWTADTRLWKTVSGKLGWVRLMSDYHPK
jgi:predicted nucleic acid-binding protein